MPTIAQTRPIARKRLEEFATLRTLVAFLGERDQFNWWDSSFLNATGRRFLAIDYPKTALAAGVHAASEAARRVHDERIGKGRVFHLFRLTPMPEHKLRQILLEFDVTQVESWLGSKEAALHQLEQLATTAAKSGSGPVRIGTTSTLSSPSTCGELARLYLDAIRSGQQTMPYFEAAKT